MHNILRLLSSQGIILHEIYIFPGAQNNTSYRLIWLFTISVRYINQLILILIATFNSFTRQSRYRDKMQKGIFDATFILEESFDAYTRY